MYWACIFIISISFLILWKYTQHKIKISDCSINLQIKGRKNELTEDTSDYRSQWGVKEWELISIDSYSFSSSDSKVCFFFRVLRIMPVLAVWQKMIQPWNSIYRAWLIYLQREKKTAALWLFFTYTQYHNAPTTI